MIIIFHSPGAPIRGYEIRHRFNVIRSGWEGGFRFFPVIY